MKDVRWLGFEWDRYCHASDYFEQLYGFAVKLVKDGLAYVDDQTKEEMALTRGDAHNPGSNSPFRNRSVEENLELLEKMRAGEFPEGKCTLRAKIDMTHPNMVMRDPLMYRIKHVVHPRTESGHCGKWCIYPMYDFAHGLSDALEGVTHSICTTEFIPRRPLYDWFVEKVGGFDPVPHQYEMSRLNLDTVMMSKRYLLGLVEKGEVSGWDDPRMPTICGARRRGIPPRGIRNFVKLAGVTRSKMQASMALWNHCVRDALNPSSPRVMVIAEPLKIVITNFDGEGFDLDVPYFPNVDELPAPSPEEDPEGAARRVRYGSRPVRLTRELWIERSDFQETPAKGFRRLAPGREVRLRYGCIVRCNEVVKGADGAIAELRCTWDPESRGGRAKDGRKVQGTIHWVASEGAVPVELRDYEPLFTTDVPGSTGDIESERNPNSLTVRRGFAEESCTEWSGDAGAPLQFERLGFYYMDMDSAADALVYNRVVTLKDSFGTKQKQKKQEEAAKRVKVLKKGEATVDEFVAMDAAAQGEYMATLSKGALKKLIKKAKKKGYKGDGKPAAGSRGGAKKNGGGTGSNGQSNPTAEMDISRLDIRVGRVLKVWKHETADRLFCEEIDLGEEGGPRQIASGMVGHITAEEFENRRVLVVCNLPPKNAMGFNSHGMVLGAKDADGRMELLEPPSGAKVGERITVEGFTGEPASATWMKKKKALGKILADCRTSEGDARTACFRGKAFMTSAGPVVAPSMAGAAIS
jgi:glutaminyl-tRNA synthetase